mgnify:CR=1 FL=1
MENPFGFFKRNASAAATDVDAAMSDVGPDELQIVEQENEQASPVLSADEDNFNLDDMLGDLKLENEGGPESVAGGLDLNLDDGSLDFLKDNGDFDLNLGEEITSVSESEKSPEAENPKPLVSEAVQEVSQPDAMEFSAEENRQETSGSHDEEAFLSPLSDDESDLLADRDGYTDETPVTAAEERAFEPEVPIAAEEAFFESAADVQGVSEAATDMETAEISPEDDGNVVDMEPAALSEDDMLSESETKFGVESSVNESTNLDIENTSESGKDVLPDSGEDLSVAASEVISVETEPPSDTTSVWGTEQGENAATGVEESDGVNDVSQIKDGVVAAGNDEVIDFTGLDETGIEEIPSGDFSFEAEMPETFSNPAVSDIENADTALPADVDADADIENGEAAESFSEEKYNAEGYEADDVEMPESRIIAGDVVSDEHWEQNDAPVKEAAAVSETAGDEQNGQLANHLKWFSGSSADKFFEISKQSESEQLTGTGEVKAIHVNVGYDTYGWLVEFSNGKIMSLRDVREFQIRNGHLPDSTGVIVYGNQRFEFSGIERILIYESVQYFSYG